MVIEKTRGSELSEGVSGGIMKERRKTVFTFGEEPLNALEEMTTGEFRELEEITVTNPETGKLEKVFIPKLTPLKKCPHCGGIID